MGDRTVGYFQVLQSCYTWHDLEQTQLMIRRGLKPKTSKFQFSHSLPIQFNRRLITGSVPLADEDGGVLIMSDHGFCADIFLSLSWAFFFFSRILLHKSCKALVIARPEILPWQRNIWHLCLPVEGSLATKAKSLETKCNRESVKQGPIKKCHSIFADCVCSEGRWKRTGQVDQNQSITMLDWKWSLF